MSEVSNLKRDPDNEGWVLGWVAFAHSPERMLGLFATEAGARAEAERMPGAEHFYASVRAGTDDYMRQ